MGDFLSAAEEARSTAAMIVERHPEMREAIEARFAEVGEQIAAIFQPYIDLADGTITEEEFAAIMDERRAADQAARLAAYGECDDPDDPEWVVPCETCGESVYFDELPPLFVECETCEQDDDDEQDDEGWL